jgi:hypothetical protein
MPWRREAAWLALLLCFGTARSAFAGELRWEPPTLCADQEQLSFQVERALGAALEGATSLVFRVRTERAKDQLRAWLSIVDTEKKAPALERVLLASDCRQLIDGLVVAITLAVGNREEQPAAAEVPAVSAAPQVAEPVAPSLVAADVEDSPTPAAVDPGQRHPWAASVWLVGDAGSLPHPGLGAALAVQAGWPELQLRALGSVLFEQQTTTRSGAAGPLGAELQLVSGTLSACAGPAWAGDWLSVCLGPEVGRLSGSGAGVESPKHRGTLWLAPRADLGLSFALPGTRFRAGVMLTAATPLTRDEFVIDGIGTVHRAASLVGRAAVGLELTSP